MSAQVARRFGVLQLGAGGLLRALAVALVLSALCANAAADSILAWTPMSVNPAALAKPLDDLRKSTGNTVPQPDVDPQNEELALRINFDGLVNAFAPDAASKGTAAKKSAQRPDPDASRVVEMLFVMPSLETITCFISDSNQVLPFELQKKFPEIISKHGPCNDGRTVYLGMVLDAIDSFSAYFTIPGSLDFVYVDNLVQGENSYVAYIKTKRQRRLREAQSSTDFSCGFKEEDAFNKKVVEDSKPKRRFLQGGDPKLVPCGNEAPVVFPSGHSQLVLSPGSNGVDTSITFPCVPGSERPTKSIKFVPAAEGTYTYTFSTCPYSETYDMLIVVRSESCDGPVLECNDDSVPGYLGCAETSVVLGPGQIVYVQVAPYSSSALPTGWSLTITKGGAASSPTQSPVAFRTATIRLAVAANMEYSNAVGGTAPLVLNAMQRTVARVNGVFSRDLSIFLQLIPENHLLICTRSDSSYCKSLVNSDPYAMINANSAFITNRGVKTSKYDLGHVFSTGGGGLAAYAVLCGIGKARGVTGRSNPTTDGFDIDYVAHELGHQLGGSHTFKNCVNSDPNRVANAAVEPGSGTTIMAYAGICGTSNVQSSSDPYLHPFSLKEINRHIWERLGGTCGTLHTIERDRVGFPVDFAPPACRLPAGMFFQVKGRSARREADPSVAEWYQWDHVNPRVQAFTDSTMGVARSWKPIRSLSRYIPNLYALTYGTWNTVTNLRVERVPPGSESWTMRFVIRSSYLSSATLPEFTLSAIGETIFTDMRITFDSKVEALKFSPATRELLSGTVSNADPIEFKWTVGGTNAISNEVIIQVAVNTMTEPVADFDYEYDAKELEWVTIGRVENTGSAELYIPSLTNDASVKVNYMIRFANSDECFSFDYIAKGTLKQDFVAPTRSPSTPRPSKSPTTSRPSKAPVISPTMSPTTSQPSQSPTTTKPSYSPTSRPTGSPTTSQPTRSPFPTPSPTPEGFCDPAPTMKKADCLARVAKCARYGRKLKFAGPGCKKKKKSLKDGGCQCVGYCAYKCAAQCRKDPECFWSKKKCRSKADKSVGKKIKQC